MNVVENKIDILILAMGGADMLRRKDLMGMMSFGGRRHFRIFYLVSLYNLPRIILGTVIAN